MALAQCPNMCSGHGDCGAENVCSCFDGFDYAPDCSLRAMFPLLSPSPPVLLSEAMIHRHMLQGHCLGR